MTGGCGRQLRLPGQATAPEGPLDLGALLLAHHGLRRDADAFAAAVRGTAVDDQRTWRRLNARWALFAEALRTHHAVEDDLLWPALRRVAGAPGAPGADEVDRLAVTLAGEHADLDRLVASGAAGLVRLSTRPDDDVRAALAVRVCATREALRRHLAHEEQTAFNLTQRLLTQDDWRCVAGRAAAAITGRRVAWTAYGVPGDALAAVFGGPDRRWVRLRWWLTRRRYAARERRAFRFA